MIGFCDEGSTVEGLGELMMRKGQTEVFPSVGMRGGEDIKID